MLIIASGLSPRAQAQAAKAAQSPAPLRELFTDLDTNNDRVVEADEIPESGLRAFRTLLRYGDANHDGKLEAGEFRDLLRKTNAATAVPLEQRESRFRKLDANHDGKLAPTEFQGGAPRFGRLDRNHDGFLSRDEIPWLSSGSVPAKNEAKGKGKRTESPIPGRLKSMDKDGDGRVSRDEFTGRAAMFSRLDANHDGFLDRSDRTGPTDRSSKIGKGPASE